jgi:hypothetical protein
VKPVMLPPGRVRLATKPWPTGSLTITKTPSSTAMSSAPRDHGDTSSTPPTTCPGASIASRPSSTLRRIALNLTKANTSEGSVRGKTKRVGCDDAFLAALILQMR